MEEFSGGLLFIIVSIAIAIFNGAIQKKRKAREQNGRTIFSGNEDAGNCFDGQYSADDSHDSRPTDNSGRRFAMVRTVRELEPSDQQSMDSFGNDRFTFDDERTAFNNGEQSKTMEHADAQQQSKQSIPNKTNKLRPSETETKQTSAEQRPDSFDFDLREAVIYSEIMKPKFDE
ncbi:MAG: hypothetical protein SOZ00_06525 [Tidjanibacter sp.]|nr:hypothetical protein [Tidjanibacter sp.]